MDQQRPGLIMCVCTGKCPGFSKMDIWDFINRVRVELPVEYGFIHPQLCEEDGDRFLADMLKGKRKVIVAGCAPNMQNKMFRDAFAAAGMDVADDLVPLDIRDMTTDEAVEKVAAALEGHGGEAAMSESTFMGVPREKIPWFPTIDYAQVRLLHGVRRVLPAPGLRASGGRGAEARRGQPEQLRGVLPGLREDLRPRRDLVSREAGDRGPD